eukprot:gene7770-9115_t
MYFNSVILLDANTIQWLVSAVVARKPPKLQVMGSIPIPVIFILVIYVTQFPYFGLLLLSIDRQAPWLSNEPGMGSFTINSISAPNYVFTMVLNQLSADTTMFSPIFNASDISSQAKESVVADIPLVCNRITLPNDVTIIEQFYKPPVTIDVYLKGEPDRVYNVKEVSDSGCYIFSSVEPLSTIKNYSSYYLAKVKLTASGQCDYSLQVPLIISTAYGTETKNVGSFQLMNAIPSVTPTTTVTNMTTYLPSNPVAIILSSVVTVQTWLKLDLANTIYIVRSSPTYIPVLCEGTSTTFLQTHQLVPSSSSPVENWRYTILYKGSTAIAPYLTTNIAALGQQVQYTDVTYPANEYPYVPLKFLISHTGGNDFIANYRRTKAFQVNVAGETISLPSPFCIISGSLEQYTCKFPMVLPIKYKDSEIDIQVNYEDTNLFAQSFTYPMALVKDQVAPWISSIELTPIGSYQVLIRVHAGDIGTGIFKIIFNTDLAVLTESHLASGTVNDGTFEGLFTLGEINTNYLSITAYDQATNVLVTNSNAFLTHSLQVVPYLVPKMADGEHRIHPCMRIITPNGDFSSNQYQGQWSDANQRYEIDFTVPKNSMPGYLAYTIMSHPEITDEQLSLKFGQQARLAIISQHGDIAPPMITDISHYTLTNGSTLYMGHIGWTITITDRPNGFLRGEINVTASMDPQPYVFILDASNRISGDIYEGVYDIHVTLQDTAMNSGFTNAPSIFNPLQIINYSARSVEMSVQVPAPVGCSIDSTPPVISQVVVVLNYDVSSNVPLAVSFNVTDPESAQLATSTPGGLSNTYYTQITLPFGFGSSSHKLRVSIFGAINNHLTIGGAYDTRSIQRMVTNIPRLTSASPITVNGGLLTLYGTGFGTVAALISGTIQTANKQPLQPAILSSSILLVYMVPASSSPYQVYITVNGTESNVLNIDPIGSSTPTPSSTPNVCPGSPVCFNHGQCLQTGCKCYSPWGGPDCSLPSVREMSQGKPVNEFTFKRWSVSSEDTPSKTIYRYSSPLADDRATLVNVTIENYKDEENVTFANELMTMTAVDSLVAIEIPYYDQQVSLDPDFKYLVGPNTDDETCSPRSKKLTPGQIAGIVVACVLFVVISVLVAAYLVQKRYRIFFNGKIELVTVNDRPVKQK